MHSGRQANKLISGIGHIYIRIVQEKILVHNERLSIAKTHDNLLTSEINESMDSRGNPSVARKQFKKKNTIINSSINTKYLLIIRCEITKVNQHSHC